MKVTAPAAVLLGTLILLFFLSPASTPVGATATDTHYLVADVGCNNTWAGVCWSHSSGGATGATVPVSTNDVVIDGNSINGNVGANADAAVRDVFFYDSAYRIGGELIGAGTSTVTFSFRNLFVTQVTPGDSYVRYVSGGHTKFSGTIIGPYANPDSCSAFVVLGLCILHAGPGSTGDLEYNGPDPFGRVSNAQFSNVHGIGKTIYCYPGCTDSGGNVGVLFVPPPIVVTNPATSVDSHTATLQGTLVDLGKLDVPPAFQRLTLNQVRVSNMSTVINTTGANLLVILIGRAAYDSNNCETVTGVFNNHGDPISTLSGSFIQFSQGDGGVISLFDVKYTPNPSADSLYTTFVQWNGPLGSCAGAVVLMTFTGVNTASALVLGNNTTKQNQNCFSGPCSVPLAVPSTIQTPIFQIYDLPNATGSLNVTFTNIVGIVNSTHSQWTCCINEQLTGIGSSLTANVATNNNVDFIARDIFVNGVQVNRTSADTYFQWGDTASLGNETSHVNQGAPIDFTTGLSTLSQTTTYYFRACALTTCGATLTFTTVQDVLGMATNAFWVLLFLAFLVVLVVGAWKVRSHL